MISVQLFFNEILCKHATRLFLLQIILLLEWIPSAHMHILQINY